MNRREIPTQAQPRPATGSLDLALKGKLLKNMATTKVYHPEVGALPLKIASETFGEVCIALRLSSVA